MASKLISKEINHLLQDAPKFALDRLQINNTCCGTNLSGNQPKRRSVNCPFSFQVCSIFNFQFSGALPVRNHIVYDKKKIRSKIS
jgi:hypothetical protein